MSTEASPYARLTAWRGAGGAQRDPLRFAMAQALATRAQQRTGWAREQLEGRLSALLSAADTPPPPPPQARATRPLQAVLDALQAKAPLSVPARGSDGVFAAQTAQPDMPHAATASPVLDEFQQLWGQVRIDSLLRQCLEAVPEDAGPLHSSVLLHRAMMRMRQVSPAYLQHFIAYVDALSWLEKLSPAVTPPPAAPRARRKPAATPRRKKEKPADG